MKFCKAKRLAVFVGVSALMTWIAFVFLRPVDLETVDVVVKGPIESVTSIENNLPEMDATVEDNPNYNVHVFYYPWYANPATDGKYLHWNHRYLAHWNEIANKTQPRRHVPPQDIGSNFYPKLGTYSSRDLRTIVNHMSQIRKSGIGVLSVSWYPPGMHDDEGEHSDSILPTLLDEALKFNLKICLHIEPYRGRNEVTLRKHLEYVASRYASHPAFYRRIDRDGHSLPLYYVYDSYLVAPESWQKLLGPPSGNRSNDISVRGTELDGIFVGLLVERQDLPSLLRGGFDGFYTYFGADGFSYGSTSRNWRLLSSLQSKHGVAFIPGVAPGYADTRVRPWNSANSRDRQNGRYYERSFERAIDSGAEIIAITSFNEWHEGTQIEEAVPMQGEGFRYLDYFPNRPNFYLRLTKKWIRKFVSRLTNHTT